MSNMSTLDLAISDRIELITITQLVVFIHRYKHLPIDDFVSICLEGGFTKSQISNAIKEYIDGRD